MIIIEYVIGNANACEESKYKFIIADEGDRLAFYAEPSDGDLPYHAEIARKNTKGDVLGGGHCTRKGSKLIVWGASQCYGSVPNQVMEKFTEELLKAYSVQETEFHMHGPPFDEAGPLSEKDWQWCEKFLKRWEKFLK